MNLERFERLEDAVTDPLFAQIDTELRQGRHVNRDEAEHYAFLRDAHTHLEAFYRQYDCELRHATDGFFYLVPNGERLGRRRLSAAEMLVGQALAMLYLDPQTVRTRGVVAHAQVVQRLETLVGTERLVAALLPRRRRPDQRVAQDNVREEVAKALRALATLGFIHTVDLGNIRLCPALLRFAEPIRGLEDRSAALARLIAEGQIESDDLHESGEAPQADV